MAQKNVAKIGLAELAKRVPPNQALQFQEFQSKHSSYQARVNKQPSKLPAIDFEFYRINVRPESQKWVDEFQQKYKTLCETFDEREKQDYSKYYVELEKLRCEMEAEVEKFKAESNERIKELEKEYERIKALKPYTEMTLEEYCDLLPEKKMYTFEGRPTFWPHTTEEQSLEPPVKGHGHDDHGGDHGKPNPKSKGGSGGDTAGGSASAPPASASESENKDAKSESKKDSKSTKAAGNKPDLLKDVNQKKAEEKSALLKKPKGTAERIVESSNKLIEEEIKHALVYDLLEESEKKHPQTAALKK